MNGTTLLASRRLAGLGDPIDTAPAPDNTFDVAGGAGPADRQQPLLRLGRGHASQRPDLGVGELATREGGGESRERLESARHANALASSAELQPDAPGQPVGARAEAVVPAAAGVELADQIEQARGGGVEVRGQLGDLMAEPVQFRSRLCSGGNMECAIHECPLDPYGNSKPGFSALLCAPRTSDRPANHDFSV